MRVLAKRLSSSGCTVFPTAVALAGIAPPVGETLDGISLVPALVNPAASSNLKPFALSQYPRCPKETTDPAFFWLNNMCEWVERSATFAMGYSLRTPTHRFTEWVRWDNTTLQPDWAQVIGRELYSHEGDNSTQFDAFENVNEADANPTLSATLSAQLRAAFRTRRDKTDDNEQDPVCDIETVQVSVAHDGGLTISLCGDSYTLASHFSYPRMEPGRWNGFGATRPSASWTVHAPQATNSSLPITIIGQYEQLYRVERRVSRPVTGSSRLLVSDLIINLSADHLGLAFENHISVGAADRPECAPRPWCTHYPALLSPCIHIAGLRQELGISHHNSYTATNIPFNPTAFIEGQTAASGGLGVVALDERFRLQLDLSHAANFSARLDNMGLGLESGKQHAYEWAIYPVPTRSFAANGTGGYWDFINRVRADYVRSPTLRGPGGWLDYYRAQWPAPVLRRWLQARGLKHLILDGPYSGGPWLGLDSNFEYKVMGRTGNGGNGTLAPFNYSHYLLQLKLSCERLRSIVADMQCAGPFETALSPDLAPGDVAVRWTDAISIQPDGQPAGYRWSTCTGPSDPSPTCQEFINTSARQYIYYPELNNSYHRYTQARFDDAFNIAELTSGYFDIFSYAYGTGGPGKGNHPDHDRWTYNQCDGYSVDLHPENYTIARCKTELSALTAPARAAVVQSILARSPNSVVVANDMGVADAIRELPIHHFLEGIGDYMYTLSHFSTPIALGFTPGYAAGAKTIGKAGTWWQTWSSDADLFEDLKDKLRSGCLYHAYYLPEQTRDGYYFSEANNVTGQAGLLNLMFPITVRQIFNGTIVGDERVITLHSGSHAFGSSGQEAASAGSSALCHCFDEFGTHFSL